MKNNQAKLNAKLKTVIDEQLEVYDLIAVFSELEINITHNFFENRYYHNHNENRNSELKFQNIIRMMVVFSLLNFRLVICFIINLRLSGQSS